MKTILAAILLTTILWGETYSLREGWNLMGAVNDIEALPEHENIQAVWSYDGEGWHKNPTFIQKQTGFWVKSTAETTIADSNASLELNIQVTGADNLDAIMEEIDKRQMTATIWLTAEEMNTSCSKVASLVTSGHEIAGMYPAQITDETTYDEQKAEIEGLLEASSRCAGSPVRGFRASRFTANDDTYRLLDEKNISYMMLSNRQVLRSATTYRPYRFDDRNFSVVPMPIAVYFGVVGSLCDVSCGSNLNPEQTHELQKAAIDQYMQLGEPLVLEWHPNFTYPESPDDWWSNLTATLDYLETLGEKVRYVTCEQILEHYPPEGSRPVEVAPWELTEE